jgi:peroxiredoxin
MFVQVGTALALAVLFAIPVSAGDTSDGPAIGSMAQPFALPDTTGKLARLSDYQPGIVMLNFWAFWCDTWKAEMPYLRDLSDEQDDLGFRIVAISVDGTRLPVFERNTRGKTPFPVLLDPGGAVSQAYSIRHVPTVVLIDETGRVRYSAHGYPGNQVILSEIRKIESGK